jgi:hypothetical protein
MRSLAQRNNSSPPLQLLNGANARSRLDLVGVACHRGETSLHLANAMSVASLSTYRSCYERINTTTASPFRGLRDFDMAENRIELALVT